MPPLRQFRDYPAVEQVCRGKPVSSPAAGLPAPGLHRRKLPAQPIINCILPVIHLQINEVSDYRNFITRKGQEVFVMRDINLGAARRAARMRSSETLFILPWFVTKTLGEHT